MRDESLLHEAPRAGINADARTAEHHEPSRPGSPALECRHDREPGDQAIGDPSATAIDPSRAGHSRRVGSLDGLRGLAALIVVVYHSLLSSSVGLSIPNQTPSRWPRTGSLTWLFNNTPLHIIWAGPEMVLVFFVLSGYVLALPAVKRGWAWFDASYYPRRLVRLYVPVWGALALAALLHAFRTHEISGATFWLNSQTAPATVSGGLHDATLLTGNASPLDPVIWSLRYEVLFSIFLPLFLAVPLTAARRSISRLLVAVACLGVMYVGTTRASLQGHLEVRFMPVFLLGVLLAFTVDRLRLPNRRGVGAIAIAVAVTLLTAGYWLRDTDSFSVTGLPYVIDVIGACLAVWLAVVCAPFERLLGTAPMRWLGSRSYSLYLVHLPIVVALSFLLVRHGASGLVLIVAVPASLLLAEVFWRAVESPAIRAARSFGHAFREFHGSRMRAMTAHRRARQIASEGSAGPGA